MAISSQARSALASAAAYVPRRPHETVPYARSALPSAAEYVPRRPHETVLYGIVREHLASFLAQKPKRSVTAPSKYKASGQGSPKSAST